MKAGRGNFFEDFRLGFELRHATPRTITQGDISLHAALYGSRFALTSSAEFAAGCGLPAAPVDDLLVFHLIYGQSEPDIATNAIADLGYAEVSFGVAVHAGDTLTATSKIIDLADSPDQRSGIVDLRVSGYNQQGETVLDFVRRVQVRKRDTEAAPFGPTAFLPALSPKAFTVPMGLSFGHYDPVLAGSNHGWEEYGPGEKIDHLDGTILEALEHRLAARLLRNAAPEAADGRIEIFHLVGIARALSFNGLGNAVKIAAINGIRPFAPCYPGDKLHAWSRIEESREIPRRPDLGALRIKTFAVKNRTCEDFPGDEGDHPDLALELDYTVLMPRQF